MSIYERALGPEHFMAMGIREHLAAWLWKQGDIEGARLLYERVLALREKELGPEHPTVNCVRAYLARLLLAAGAAGDALALGETPFPAHEKAFGVDNASTKHSARTAADVFAALARMKRQQ